MYKQKHKRQQSPTLLQSTHGGFYTPSKLLTTTLNISQQKIKDMQLKHGDRVRDNIRTTDCDRCSEKHINIQWAINYKISCECKY